MPLGVHPILSSPAALIIRQGLLLAPPWMVYEIHQGKAVNIWHFDAPFVSAAAAHQH